VKRFAAAPLQARFAVMRARSDKRAVILALSMLLLSTGSAWSQSAPSLAAPGVQAPGPEPPAAPAPTSPAPPREENPGLINEIGKLIDKLSPLKSPLPTIDDLNARAREAAKGASDSLSRLARPAGMVSGRMVCPVSADGAPDCKLGADRLCQSKGYKDGKSLNTDSAETCSAKVLIPGRVRKPDDCRTDNYVTSALCQ